MTIRKSNIGSLLQWSQMWIDIFMLVLLCGLFLLCLWWSWIVWGFFHYDVPFVPSRKIVAKAILSLAELRGGEKIYDLGSGTGKLLLQRGFPSACKRVGYEQVGFFVWWGNVRARFTRGNVSFRRADFFQQDYRDADVIFCYLLPEIMPRVRDEIFSQLPKGAKLISQDFPIQTLTPDKIVHEGKTTLFLYVKA